MTYTTTAQAAHTLTFEAPTARDGYWLTDLIAQCSCGAYEYVYSRREGVYWHGLHKAQPTRNPHYLMLNAPMPEGWEEAPELAVVVPVQATAPRAYTCPRCVGAGSFEMYGPLGGRFYHNERATCPDCSGSGVTDRWAA